MIKLNTTVHQRPRHWRRQHAQLGLASIEVVLVVLGFMLPILFGTIEVARILYNYNTLVKSVRDAARFMSVQSPSATDYAAKVTAAKNMVVFGNQAGTGAGLVPGLTTAMVSVGEDANGSPLPLGSAGNLTFQVISVRVSGYQLGLVSTMFGTNKAFNTISSTMRQRSQ